MRVVTLGEILLRLSTYQDVRIKDTDNFRICYGGAETNVGISLSQFGHTVSVASVLPSQNPLSDAVISRLNSYGVDTKEIFRKNGRLGSYFLEQGNSVRGSKVLYDRAFSSIAMLEEFCWDFDAIFQKVDLVHISGILPTLSKKWEVWILEIVEKAKKYGCLVSFDINYRSSLWGYDKAYSFFQKIFPYVDILSAGKLDAIHFLKVSSEDEEISLQEIYNRILVKYPNIKVLYSTTRIVNSTNHHKLQGFFIGEDGKFVESKLYDINPVIDRVGGGDAFSAGILNGILKGWDSRKIVEFGTSSSVLKHTVFGDWNQFDEEEVFNFMENKTGCILR